MVDIPVDPAIDRYRLRSYLEERIAGLEHDSVVRLKSIGEPDERLRTLLTARFLRSVFPGSMNVVLGREFGYGS